MVGVSIANFFYRALAAVATRSYYVFKSDTFSSNSTPLHHQSAFDRISQTGWKLAVVIMSFMCGIMTLVSESFNFLTVMVFSTVILWPTSIWGRDHGILITCLVFAIVLVVYRSVCTIFTVYRVAVMKLYYGEDIGSSSLIKELTLLNAESPMGEMSLSPVSQACKWIYARMASDSSAPEPLRKGAADRVGGAISI